MFVKNKKMKPQITIDDFSAMSEKLDIRYGTITAVEFLPKNKRMLKLEVDFGTEQRTVITNIGDKVPDPEDSLLCKLFPFVMNLPAFELKGVVSTAMILVPTSADDAVQRIPQVGSKLI